MNPTAVKFGFPETLIREYRHWLVLLRPAQVTAGSLVLAANGDARTYGDLPAEAFAEQAEVVADIETALRSAVNFDKINYLMLMMVDPDVHFHVFPRYAGERTFAGITIEDAAWPGPPDLASATKLEAGQVETAVGALRALFPRRLA